MRSAVKREAPLRLQSRPRPRRRAVPLKTLYTASDLAGVAHLNSMPGAAPFVRGPYASMYTAKPWTIRQYAGYAEAADSNLAFRTALAEGAQGLSVAFDLPTQRGYDSDDPRTSAEVGLAGVAIDTVEDMARLFAGIPLDRTSVSMTMNGAVLPVLAAFIVAAEERGVAAAQLTGTIQNDILKEFIVRNTCIFAPEPSLRIAADVVDYLARHAPRFNALSVSGYHFQEAGADPVLELALTMAHARTYIETLGARGMNADDACERMSFFFGVGTDFYVEVAKLRAARLVWSELATQCGAASDKARALRMHCQTSGWSLTAQKPSNNIVRTTVEALAAVFGGTQSLHTNAFDEALALPSASSSRLARDTQLMLQHEMGLCDVVDPWAGSYMMEALTADIAARVRSLIGEIDARGGIVQAIRSGWIRQRIHESAVTLQAEIDSGQRVVVGVNAFVHGDADEAPECFELDGKKVRGHQLRRIAEVKLRRDAQHVARALDALETAARAGTDNLVALTIRCMRARATVGECTRALEAVWPRHAIGLHASAGIYEETLSSDARWKAACEQVDELTSTLGRKPRVMITKLGQDGHDRGAQAVAAALIDAGFEVVSNELFISPAEVARRALANEVDMIGVSSLAGAHVELTSQLMRELRARHAAIPVVLGGNVQAESAGVLKALGVAEFFLPGTRMHEIVLRLVRLVAC
ncbi:methylmalonyl-CoA mutase [Paraburkholderia terricola]|uniref:Methylmalonyl-CoA mutase n=1 Tax=Paraburkholderia terricola TaxID=169427 RepID=A0ABU1LXI1_9BURK|nr:methylmalonyl-CoA mutase [Paraburkholderia terricola]MDR6411462.1 methylmalonyl-CoA mutase [Paraburkholderia terricola]MDR6483625.1 methylmalonyl-CoA mutase [Paraburkholderia terricola]